MGYNTESPAVDVIDLYLAMIGLIHNTLDPVMAKRQLNRSGHARTSQAQSVLLEQVL